MQGGTTFLYRRLSCSRALDPPGPAPPRRAQSFQQRMLLHFDSAPLWPSRGNGNVIALWHRACLPAPNLLAH